MKLLLQSRLLQFYVILIGTECPSHEKRIVSLIRQISAGATVSGSGHCTLRKMETTWNRFRAEQQR